MAGRFLVSGVQLGMIIGFIKAGNKEDALNTIEFIIKDQFVWSSSSDISNDVVKVNKLVESDKEE